MSIRMKKRFAQAVSFLCIGSCGETTCRIFFNVSLSSMYDIMDCLRQTEQDFRSEYAVDVNEWRYRVLSSEELSEVLKSLNIEGN